MAMSYEQITGIINANGGKDHIAIIINDAGNTIDLRAIDVDSFEISKEHNAVIYPAYCNELDEIVTTFLSLDSVADIRMTNHKVSRKCDARKFVFKFK